MLTYVSSLQDAAWSILTQAVTSGATEEKFDEAFSSLASRGHVGLITVTCVVIVPANEKKLLRSVLPVPQEDLAVTLRRVRQWIFMVIHLLPLGQTSWSNLDLVSDLFAVELAVQTWQQDGDAIEESLGTVPESDWSSSALPYDTEKLLVEIFVKAIPEAIEKGVKLLVPQVVQQSFSRSSPKLVASLTRALVEHFKEKDHWRDWTNADERARKRRLNEVLNSYMKPKEHGMYRITWIYFYEIEERHY
jgi:hypothetical protein